MATIKQILLWTGILLAIISIKVLRTYNKVRTHNTAHTQEFPNNPRFRLGNVFKILLVFLLIFTIFIQIINIMDAINREALLNQLLAVVQGIINHLPNPTPDNITQFLRVSEMVLPILPIITFIIATAICISFYFHHPRAVDRTSEVLIALINHSAAFYMNLTNHFAAFSMNFINNIHAVLVSRPARGTPIMLILLVLPMLVVTMSSFTAILSFWQGTERICLMVIGVPLFVFVFWEVFGRD